MAWTIGQPRPAELAPVTPGLLMPPFSTICAIDESSTLTQIRRSIDLSIERGPFTRRVSLVFDQSCLLAAAV